MFQCLVTGVSIRLRILKVDIETKPVIRLLVCYRGIDPFEDTESSIFAFAYSVRIVGYRGIDPFEDTERHDLFYRYVKCSMLQGYRSV